jgi:phage baseplate assembly protein W
MVKAMRGISATGGKELERLHRLKQLIIDILTTLVGSRIMRRDYGSWLFELIDRPINRDFTLEIYAATAKALQKLETRLKLEKVKITEVKEGKNSSTKTNPQRQAILAGFYWYSVISD